MLANIFAIVYFVAVMWWILLLLLLVPLVMFQQISVIISSGFASQSVSVAFIAVFSFFIGISLLVPYFRKMYYKFPWLFTYVKILYVNVIILGVAVEILNYGYQVQDSLRHALFLILMVFQITICMLLMSLYFKKRKVTHIGE